MLMNFEDGDLLWNEVKDEVEGLRNPWLGVSPFGKAGIGVLVPCPSCPVRS
jgi:hypothetical protein